MKQIIILILVAKFSLFNQVKAQNDDIWAVAAAGVGLAIAIEKNKEILENLAANYVMKNFPEYDEFNLKVIGIGGGGKKISGEGTVSFVPFAFTQLKDGKLTDNRKLILLFASKGWINKFGVDYTRLKWQVWDVNKWNKLITQYSLLNSPFKLTITGGLFPTYRQKISSNLDWELDANNFNKISDLNISSTGLKLKNKIVFPFYNLEGDDYIVEDFNNEIKIFVNEGSLGIFLKDTYDSILISRNLINKVHNFINGRKMAEKN
ncbi:MAG: hypothetical protein CMD25_07375 [Flavobacteriales bacterium]|nr:hypothetical protein [Flavobacteriales bacterium]|tara:strand:- start:1033 stop:1821 length:789 start_codon:yes stop_codon:yes gene_type:complete